MAFVCVQMHYVGHILMTDFDTMLGLPELPHNPYAWWPHFFTAAAELTLCSIIAHIALNWKDSLPFTRALWVFVGLGAWNQMIDVCFGSPDVYSVGELVFFGFTICLSTVTFIKWQNKR